MSGIISHYCIYADKLPQTFLLQTDGTRLLKATKKRFKSSAFSVTANDLLPLQKMCLFMTIRIKATPLLTYYNPVGNGPIKLSDILTSQSRHNQYHTCSSSFILSLFLPPSLTHTLTHTRTHAHDTHCIEYENFEKDTVCHNGLKRHFTS